MFETVNQSTEEKSLSSALLNYYDEFTEFNDHCAFLCDAFACIVRDREDIDEYVVNGMGRCSQWLKERTLDLKLKLKDIHELSKTT